MAKKNREFLDVKVEKLTGYIYMNRIHRISERTLNKWRGAFIWVDIWHLAPWSDSVERFSMSFKATWKRDKETIIGREEFYSIQGVIDFCVRMLRVLPSLRLIWGVRAFSIHGSSKYTTEWLREQIETSLKQDKS